LITAKGKTKVDWLLLHCLSDVFCRGMFLTFYSSAWFSKFLLCFFNFSRQVVLRSFSEIFSHTCFCTGLFKSLRQVFSHFLLKSLAAHVFVLVFQIIFRFSRLVLCAVSLKSSASSCFAQFL